MATIKLSRAQWEMIGNKTGWIKTAVLNAGWIKTAVLNALLEKGWAKKMPDGNYSRTYWPAGLNLDDPVNIMIKNGVEDGTIKQQQDGSFVLV